MAYASYEQLKSGKTSKPTSKSVSATYDLLKQNIGGDTISTIKKTLEENDRKRAEQETIEKQQQAVADFNKRREEIASGGIFTRASDIVKTLFKGSDTLPEISGGSPEYQQIREETLKAKESGKITTIAKEKALEYNAKNQEYLKSLVDSGMSPAEAINKFKSEQKIGFAKNAGGLASGTAKLVSGLTPSSGFSSVRRIIKTVGGEKVDEFFDRNTPEYYKKVDAKMDEDGILNYHPKYANIAQKTGGEVAEIGSWFIPITRLGKTEKLASVVSKIPFIEKTLGVTPKLIRIGGEKGGKLFFEASLDAIDIATLDAIRGKSVEDIESDAKAGFIFGGITRGAAGSVSALIKRGTANKVSKVIEDSIGTLTDDEKNIVDSMVQKNTPTDDIIVSLIIKRNEEGTNIAPEVSAIAKKESPTIEITNEERISREIASTNDSDIITEKLKGLVPENDLPVVSKAMKNMDNPDDIQKMLDGFNPEKIKDELSLQFATTDSEKKIASMLKGMIPESEIPTVSRMLKGIENETQIRKIMDDMNFDVLKNRAIDTITSVEKAPKKTVEKPVVSEKKTPESPLLQEAKKYKSAEEFVKAQSGEKYQHRMLRDTADADLIKIKDEGFYPEELADFNRKLRPFESKYSRKPNIVKSGERGISGTKKGETVILIPENAIIDGKNGPFVKPGWKPTDAQIVKIKYDGQLPQEAQYQQLTDLYNKAQGGSPLLQEAGKTPVEAKVSVPKVPLKTEEGAKTVKSKFSKGILKRSVKRGIISDLEAAKANIPEFEKMNLDDQAERAMKVLEDDKKTWDIIEGRANPEDQKLRPGSVYVAKYNEAKATGDVDTMMRLANSEGAAGVANEFGTGLKAFDTRDVFDPLKVMKEIKKHKEAIIEKSNTDIKKSIKETVNEMKEIAEKNVSTDTDLEKLVIDNIC